MTHLLVIITVLLAAVLLAVVLAAIVAGGLGLHQGATWQQVTQKLPGNAGGATALAAVLSGAYKPRPGERVGILLCGGNVDLAKAAELIG